MNLKLLFIITNDEKKTSRVVNKFKLPFNTIMHGIGTASKSMLDFFGLIDCEKVLSISIIPDYQEKEITNYLRGYLKLQEIGNGIAFTVPLTSSSAYVRDVFKKKEDDEMDIKRNYHLLMTIVQEGYADRVMSAAKKNGANGGTLVKGRGMGGKNSLKLFNMTIEPEKDIVLIVCDSDNKNRIMEAILEKVGVKTEGKGVCISIPIDSTVGINE